MPRAAKHSYRGSNERRHDEAAKMLPDALPDAHCVQLIARGYKETAKPAPNLKLFGRYLVVRPKLCTSVT